MKKSRGRPPSQETIESRRIEEMFKNLPEYIKQADLDDQDEMLKSLDEAERQILSDYKSYPTIPRSHIFEMASIGDESLRGFESLITQHDEDLMNQIQINRQKGSQETQSNSLKTAKELCEKNSILLSRMKPAGKLSKNRVASIIKSQWVHVPLELRQLGEERLECRGVKSSGLNIEKIPSIRTIERYIDLVFPLNQKKIRQGS